MAVYEYSCENCGIIEVYQKITDKELGECPKCQCKIVRLISLTGIPQFKGTGFHTTDYKKSKT